MNSFELGLALVWIEFGQSVCDGGEEDEIAPFNFTASLSISCSAHGGELGANDFANGSGGLCQGNRIARKRGRG